MLPKDDGSRGPPIGVLKSPDHENNNNNNSPNQAILSIYKSYKDFISASTQRRSSSASATAAAGFSPSTTLCTFSIPSYMSIPDFLNFVGPVDSFVRHYRVLCDGTPHTYIVLMTFRDEKVGHDYYKQYNQRKFSSMEDQVCQVVYIKTISIMDGTLGDTSRFSLEYDNDDTGHNCPVCLDPMDEALTGLLTTLCQHTFHVHCLSQWGDGSCPVCRYSQKPATNDISSRSPSPPPPRLSQLIGVSSRDNADHPSLGGFFHQDEFTNQCHVCGCKDHLWICLVCGEIGCGQQHEAHALAHYTDTHHLYALEIDSQRVWDYAGDNYVHRLIQNVVDGKIVELPNPIQQQQPERNGLVSEMAQGKWNAMALEYSYLLTSQLDSQRMYYEDRINATLDQLAQMADECKQLTCDIDVMQAENDLTLADQVETSRKRNATLVNKVAQWKEKTKLMERNHSEEKELTKSISQNNALVMDDIAKVQRHLDVMAAKSAEWMTYLEQDDGPSSS
ncbi:hypothetical protein BCR42DRAFT_421241 [Absidia repens]|uniref:BRCA1-associated protein 2-domain-containing protein n=1 Tax=Absidia repens TaxID=90262 RepID=A0A1X2I9S7_9FUNG|nr:hypothetical protein BCR42DRAFT_421241 [Absidia repens]